MLLHFVAEDLFIHCGTTKPSSSLSGTDELSDGNSDIHVLIGNYANRDKMQ